MAKVYAAVSGGPVIGYRRDEAEERLRPLPPSIVALEFDETTNQIVLRGLDRDPDGHTLTAGSPPTLRRRGEGGPGTVVVAIAADGPLWQERILPPAVRAAIAALPPISPAEASAAAEAIAALAPGGPVPTAAQVRLALRVALQLHRPELRRRQQIA